MKTIKPYLILLCVAGWYACAGTTEKEQVKEKQEVKVRAIPRQNFPENGNFYFSATDTTMEKYLTMNIKKRQVEGRLYVSLNGDMWYHDFSGRFVNDTTLQITVSYKETTNDEEWRLHLRNKILSVSNIYQENKVVKFAPVDPEMLADTVDYIRVESFDPAEE